MFLYLVIWSATLLFVKVTPFLKFDSLFTKLGWWSVGVVAPQCR